MRAIVADPPQSMPSGFSRTLALLVLLVTIPASRALAADPAKVLHIAFPGAETSFDPAFASDAASDSIIENVFDTMLDYDYLARPVRLVPRALEAMPAVEDGGRTYVCKVRKGIFFTPDPAFKGKRRELTAEDFAYGIERILDPAVKSPWLWLFEGRIVGGDEARAKAAKTGHFDYDSPIAGLEAVDRYTLRIRLISPDLRFPYALAVPNVAAQAREVVEAYGNDIGAHPVGTGPYMLGAYQRSTRIELVANPGFRETHYVPAGPIPPESQPVADALKDKRLPLAGRIEISVIEEGQARWLAFLKGEVDTLDSIPVDFVDQALDNGRLKPALAARGIVHDILIRPNTYWTYFNMKDPVVGGYTPAKIALRRAIAMGYDVGSLIRVLLKGRAVPATGPVPPDIAGYDPALKTQAQIYDPAAARALLDRFGYKDVDGDGYREMPDGKPLTIVRWSTPGSGARQGDELWKRNMDAIGIRMVFRQDRLAELRKMARLGKIQTRGDGWNADYPDAENFMQLLYGPNAAQENNAQFDLPEFNRLFEQARSLPDSPQRTQLFDRMTRIAIAYAPWRMTYHLIADSLHQPWIGNFVPHPIREEFWEYLDVDPEARAKPPRP
ncbi:MAG TPA: ABC transporter substrate-binding protein [Casimicrobiaceae bacterium]|nr:ABC transporter substrate-binding protein [Casimicrobiaceae bacterium]